MKIGALELLVIFVVALLVIGPDKLPQYARKFGNAMREFRKASSDVTQEIRESVIDPLEEAQKSLREALEPLEEMDKDLRQNIKGVETDLKNIGKPKKEEKSTPAEKPESGAESPESEPPEASGEEAAPVPENNTEPSPAVEAPREETISENNGGEQP